MFFRDGNIGGLWAVSKGSEICANTFTLAVHFSGNIDHIETPYLSIKHYLGKPFGYIQRLPYSGSRILSRS